MEQFCTTPLCLQEWALHSNNKQKLMTRMKKINRQIKLKSPNQMKWIRMRYMEIQSQRVHSLQECHKMMAQVQECLKKTTCNSKMNQF